MSFECQVGGRKVVRRCICNYCRTLWSIKNNELESSTSRSLSLQGENLLQVFFSMSIINKLQAIAAHNHTSIFTAMQAPFEYLVDVTFPLLFLSKTGVMRGRAGTSINNDLRVFSQSIFTAILCQFMERKWGFCRK